MKNHIAPLMAAALALLASAPLLVSCGGDESQVVHVTRVTLRDDQLNMHVGDTRELGAVVDPPNATNRSLTWRSTNFLVAEVSADGKVTALKAGTSTIVATSVDGGHMALCNIAVGSSVTGISVVPGALPLFLSGTGTLAAMIAPDDAVDKTVTWVSSDNSVATVAPIDDGLFCHVVAQSVGSATVTATARDGGRSAQCQVTVEAGTIVPAEGVGLNKESTVVGMGSQETLVATVQPEDATIRAIRWSSSDTAVATVSGNGLVRAVSPGRAVVTARTYDGGFEAECDVTIASVYAAGYEFSPGISVSKLWKDGEPQNLSSGAGTAVANSVYVAGSVVYAAGFEHNADYRPVARLWVNGSPQSLSDGTRPAFANSVFVSNSNVYVAGHDEDGKVSTARLWLNGTPMNLSSGARSAEARSVFVSDGHYYVAGHEMGEQGRTAVRLWTSDPRQQQLGNGGRDEQATCVFVSGGNAFVSGFEKNDAGRTVAKLWINGSPTNLTDGRHNAKANAVFVAENNTYYAVGYEYNASGYSVAKLWTNAPAQNQSQSLSSGTKDAEALSVYVLGNGAYVAGSENNPYNRPTARLWLNAAPHPLGNGTDNSAALAVFLR